MRKTALVVGGLALVMTLTGCGERAVSGQASPAPLFTDAQELVRAATSQTDKSKSSKFSMEMSVGGQQISGEGSGRYDGANSAMSLTMTAAGQTQEMRLVDKVMYIKLPEQARATMSDGKPWAKLPEGSEAAKALGSSMDSAEQNNPTKILENIQKAGTITRSEQTALDGQPVSHYWIDLDLAKAADMLSNTQLSQEMIDEITTKVKTIPMELWLNSDQLPVQITQDLGQIMQAAGAASGAGGMTITLKYTDWGTPVDVQAPPADQVGELKIGG